MRAEDIEKKIKSSVEGITPDVLDSILSRCGAREGNVYIIQPAKPKARMWRPGAAGAAAFVLAVGGVFGYSWVDGNRLDTLVMLDVNPSIEIEVNKNERVIGVAARNDDAVKILDGMDLKDTQINVAINALVGSMLKHGYIKENANSVLLSVEGADGAKSAALQKNLTESISLQLNMVNGAVISQSLSGGDAETRTLAAEHQISYGKAALVQKILAENSHLVFADLAALTVNELNLLVGSKRIVAAGMASQGSASETDYIGGEAAEQTALSHAGVDAGAAEILHVELDYDDGAIVYEVEFIYGGREYEYEIDAKDGSVLEHDSDGMGGDRRKPQNGAPKPQPEGDFIGESKAAELAAGHAGIALPAEVKSKLDKDDGLYIYEVEFRDGGREYEYEINAATGEIVSWEAE